MFAKKGVCHKYILRLILVLSVFAIFTLQTHAAEDSIFSRCSNSVYRFINKNEYLVIIVSDAAAGLSICGPWCALGGGAAGVIDEGLVYYGYTGKHYLSYGIVGSATGHMVKPLLTFAGLVGGAYLSGAFKGHEELIAPAFLFSMGLPAYGYKSGIVVISALVGDSALKKSNITDIPVMSWICVPVFLQPSVGKILSGLITIYAAIGAHADINVTQIVTNPLWKVMTVANPELQNVTRIGMKLYDNYGKFIPQEALDEHLEKQVLSLIAGQQFTYWLIVKQIELFQGMRYLFEHLDNPQNVAGNTLRGHAISFGLFLIPWTAGQVVNKGIEKYYNDRLKIVVKNNLQQKLYANETLLRLSNYGNFSVYMDNFHQDMAVVTDLASLLIGDAVSVSVSGMYGTGIVVQHSPRLLVYTLGYQVLSVQIMSYLAAQGMVYDDRIKFLHAELLDLYKDTKDNVRTIIEREGLATLGDRIQNISTDLVEAEGGRNLWYMYKQVYGSFDDIAGYVINYLLVAKELQRKTMAFDNRNLLYKSLQDSNVFTWGNRNAVTIGQLEKSLDRLLVIVNIINSPPSDVDKIARITKDCYQLQLRDLEIGVNDRVLVKDANLDFTLGRVYAITGETGCGKTSLLTKIKGLKDNGIGGRGTIYYPKMPRRDPKIFMLSQRDYFPLRCSLKELLVYPSKFPNDSESGDKLKTAMQTLLQDMQLQRFISGKLDLDSQKDWYTLLSGGEKKKMLIISAILQKPDILILDEVFNGLDADSVGIVQKVLKKYLPRALILVVDHHAQDNNHDFYDYEVRFRDKNLTRQELPRDGEVQFSIVPN